jgi:hypothetical protein
LTKVNLGFEGDGTMIDRAGIVGTLVTGALIVVACTSSVQGTTTTTGTGGHGGQGTSAASSGATTSGDGASNPGTGTTTSGGTGGAMCPPSIDTMLAVDRIYYGDTDFDNTPDQTNGWKQYGFDLDGKISTATSTDLCIPLNNAPVKNVYPDGTNGIDNSFGRNLLPIFLGLVPSFSTQANAGLTGGKSTLLIKLGALGAAADQSPIVTKVYTGAPLAKAPEFDTDDCWPVTAESVTSAADVESAKLAFPTSTLAADHWTSVTSGDLDLTVQVGMSQMHLILHQARMSMDLDSGHQNALTGMIGGVLDTEELVTELKRIIGDFDPTLCSGPTVDSIVAQIRQASDILKDATQDPTKSCDGISIGLGFKAAKIGVGAVAPPAPPLTSSCGP